MQKTVVENQELIILSSEVTNATRCKVVEITPEDVVSVELETNEIYKDNEEVELFTVSGSGVLYFKTHLVSVNGQTLTLKMPEKYGLIQRREYTRVEISKKILIKSETKNIRAEITDISAGGMRLLTDTEMNCDKDYNIDLKLEDNLEISATFQPVRVKPAENDKFTVSGKFSLITNINRVALAQYCLRKQTEAQNK